MKKAIKFLAITALISLVPMLLSAQPLPYDTTVGGGETNNPVGGGAPLGGGLIIMLALGAGYGTRKIYDARK
jgi:hypothetical protein